MIVTEPPRPCTPYGDVDAAVERARTPPPWNSPPPADRTALERLHHCWALHEEIGWLPGLLVEWRGSGDAWEGRVIVPSWDAVDERWRPREVWLPADRIEER